MKNNILKALLCLTLATIMAVGFSLFSDVEAKVMNEKTPIIEMNDEVENDEGGSDLYSTSIKRVHTERYANGNLLYTLVVERNYRRSLVDGYEELVDARYHIIYP